jgi:hypothetical protein
MPARPIVLAVCHSVLDVLVDDADLLGQDLSAIRQSLPVTAQQRPQRLVVRVVQDLPDGLDRHVHPTQRTDHPGSVSVGGG